MVLLGTDRTLLITSTLSKKFPIVYTYLTAGWGRRGCCHTVRPQLSLSGCRAGHNACWVAGNWSRCCCTESCHHRAQKLAPCKRTHPLLLPRTRRLCRYCTPSLRLHSVVHTALQTDRQIWMKTGINRALTWHYICLTRVSTCVELHSRASSAATRVIRSADSDGVVVAAHQVSEQACRIAAVADWRVATVALGNCGVW